MPKKGGGLEGGKREVIPFKTRETMRQEKIKKNLNQILEYVKDNSPLHPDVYTMANGMAESLERRTLEEGVLKMPDDWENFANRDLWLASGLALDMLNTKEQKNERE